MESDTLTFPVVTQETSACTILSSQRESPKDAGWLELVYLTNLERFPRPLTAFDLI